MFLRYQDSSDDFLFINDSETVQFIHISQVQVVQSAMHVKEL